MTIDEELPVFFFDLDNCLYSQNHGISQMMGEKIQAYFAKSLSLTHEEAQRLHHRYYTDYGLALQGLIRHHRIDPLDYNAEVDDALPLETCLKPDPGMRSFLESIDRSKVRLWILTNAYINHAKRVLRLLGLEDLFEGITYCDYTEGDNLTCKPYPAFFERAMRQAGITDKSQCYFVDDSFTNIEGAVKYGWQHSVYYREPQNPWPRKTNTGITCHEITSLYDLARLYPSFFVEVRKQS